MSSLDDLVYIFAQNKEEIDSRKKVTEDCNKQIKDLMKSENLTSHTVGNYTVKYREDVSESFDEDKLLEKIQHMTYKDGTCGSISVATGLKVVKYKPYVDMEALEKAIYDGFVDASELADCKVKKVVPKLILTKKKGE